MKLAFLNDSGCAEYLLDMVLDGAIRLFGRENIYIEGWQQFLNDVTKNDFYWLYKKYTPINIVTLEECDYVIAGIRARQLPNLISKKIVNPNKLAIIDTDDFIDFGSRFPEDNVYNLTNINQWEFYKNCKVYFKREMLLNQDYSMYKKIVDLSFAAVPDDIPINNRNYKAFFSGRIQHRHPYRGQVVDYLKTINNCHIYEFKNWEDWKKDLTSYNIGISIRGAGWDVTRYWEIPYFGAMLISSYPEIHIHNNYINKEHCAFYSNFEDLRNLINYYTDDKNITEVKQIQKSGQEFTNKYHLTTNRIQRVLEYLI